MKALAHAAPAGFIRRTALAPGECRVNFRQIDNDAIEAVTSDEASAVTPLMSKIYLRLIHAPLALWEGPGVLRLMGEVKGERTRGAWEQLVSLLGVAPATARKAIVWMHARGVIGYFAGRNGAGIRVFINRAANSIRAAVPGQKNLPRDASSIGTSPTSPGESPLKELVSEESLEFEDPRAPWRTRGDDGLTKQGRDAPASFSDCPTDLGRVLDTWKEELGALIAGLCDRELARTREWLDRAGLPKATRVAQRETYNLLRSHGVITDRGTRGGRVGESARTDSSPSAFTREEEVRLCADYATEVCGVSLSDFLDEYVSGGEMTHGEAQAILFEARGLGLNIGPTTQQARHSPHSLPSRRPCESATG